MKVSAVWLGRSVYMGNKTKEQLPEELLEVQKTFEEKTETQGCMIKKFQMLIKNEGLFSQIIDSFPYPIAIFTNRFTLAMVNKAFTAETKIRFMKPESGDVRIIQYKIQDMRLASAVKKVFRGDTFFLEDIKNPFSMFVGISQESKRKLDRFHKVIIFPVPANGDGINHGVIVFIP
jgi:hypothetical protein